MTKVVAIWNPNSGGAASEDELRDALGPDIELVETSRDDPGTGQARSAVQAGADVVAACGGDGTVRACLEPLAGTTTSLGVVPLGTGNLLAANLGLPGDLSSARRAFDHDPERIDLGNVNGEPFAVMAGSGFDALMIRDASDTAKARVGPLAYVASAAHHVRSELVHTTVTVDGVPWFSGRTTMVLVGNFGTVSGGLEVFPDADAADGRLDVAVMAASNITQWSSVLWRLLRGRPQRPDLVRRTQGRSIVVDLERARPYELDGEARDPVRHLEFDVQPAALLVHRLPSSGSVS
jgi:diacylglycerol kinase (ATP)